MRRGGGGDTALRNWQSSSSVVFRCCEGDGAVHICQRPGRRPDIDALLLRRCYTKCGHMRPKTSTGRERLPLATLAAKRRAKRVDTSSVGLFTAVGKLVKRLQVPGSEYNVCPRIRKSRGRSSLPGALRGPRRRNRNAPRTHRTEGHQQSGEFGNDHHANSGPKSCGGAAMGYEGDSPRARDE